MLIRPENSAIKRNKPSVPARYAAEHIIPNLPSRIICCPPIILDYGCGYGADVSFYKSLGAIADGYDPNPKFGFDKIPDKKYDLITCIYVLNVIPDRAERLYTIIDALQYLRPNGILFLAARTKNEIDTLADKKSWTKYKDGYYTGKYKKTFQCGFSIRKLRSLIKHDALYSLLPKCTQNPLPQIGFCISKCNGFIYSAIGLGALI